MPKAGGAYDQDMDLVDAVSIVEVLQSTVNLDAGQVHKLPGHAKRFRRFIKKLAEEG